MTNVLGVDFVSTNHSDTYATIDPLKADLTGRIVVITGASRGIGRSIAISYAKAGASGFMVLARSDLAHLEDEILAAAEKAGRNSPKIFRAQVDITDRAAVEKVVKESLSMFGHIDILINNAGYMEEMAPLADTDPDEWWKTFEINVKGVYLITRSFLPFILKSRLKTIVTCSTVGANLNLAGSSAYSITKSAVLRLNDLLMAEYGDQGLLAYAIHPGGVKTDLAQKLPDDMQSWIIDAPGLCGDTLVFLTRERQEW